MKYGIITLLVIILFTLMSCTDNSANPESLSITIENQMVSISIDSLHEENRTSSDIKSVQVVPIEDFEGAIDYSDIYVFAEKAVHVNDTIYIPVLCKGLYDEYVYNIADESGRYMSGTESLCGEYENLIKTVQENRYPCYLNCLVSSNNDLSAAVVRKSKIKDYVNGRYLSGEYYLFDLKTATAKYICDSYPNCRDTIPGTRIESIEWDGNNSAKIFTYNSNDKFCVYTISREDSGWEITAESTQNPN